MLESQEPRGFGIQKPRKKDLFERISREVADLSWEELKRKIAASHEQIIDLRKKELLGELSPEKILAQLPKESITQIHSFFAFRGLVFESLVNQEMNEEEENSAVANFVLACLRNPAIVGVGDLPYRNPDHVGVIVDREKQMAYITGMYEVKMSGFGQEMQEQLASFYSNLGLITQRINIELARLRSQFNFSFIPEKGVELKPLIDFKKFIVFPYPKGRRARKLFQQRKALLEEKQWGIRSSVFSRGDVALLSAYLMKYYERNKDTVDSLRAKGI